MALSSEEVKCIQQQFEQEYFYPKPYSKYVNAVAPRRDIDGDWYISVSLLEPLPLELSLPIEYQGVEVVVEVAGEIRPQEPT